MNVPSKGVLDSAEMQLRLPEDARWTQRMKAGPACGCGFSAAQLVPFSNADQRGQRSPGTHLALGGSTVWLKPERNGFNCGGADHQVRWGQETFRITGRYNSLASQPLVPGWVPPSGTKL